MSDIKFCPACGGYYREPPALSRKDNRTAICPECGLKEALEAASFNAIFGETLKAFSAARKEGERCSASL